MTDRQLAALIIAGGTILAILIALTLCAWVGSYTIHFTPQQLPTI